MEIDDATLSARLRQISDEAPKTLMASTFYRAQQIIIDTYAAGCSFHAYGDGGLGTAYAPMGRPDPHGAEIVADHALGREIWRQMLILQGPENTIPSIKMTAEEMEIWNRRNAGEGWARSAAARVQAEALS